MADDTTVTDYEAQGKLRDARLEETINRHLSPSVRATVRGGMVRMDGAVLAGLLTTLNRAAR